MPADQDSSGPTYKDFSASRYFDAVYTDDLQPVDGSVTTFVYSPLPAPDPPVMEVVPLRSQVSYNFRYSVTSPGRSYDPRRITEEDRAANQAAFNQQLQDSFKQQSALNNAVLDTLSSQLNQVYTNSQVATRLANGQVVTTPRPANTTYCDLHGGLRETGTTCMYCDRQPKFIDIDPWEYLFDPRD